MYPNDKPPKSKLKRNIIVSAITILVIAIGLFVVYPVMYSSASQSSNDANDPWIAKVSPDIDFNRENGLLYVNNEVIVMTYRWVSERDVESLAQEFRATVDVSMRDIGFYQFSFSDAMTYDELNRTLRQLRTFDIIEDAYFNPVFEIEDDSSGEDDFITAEPVHPNDPWDNASWNTRVPSDSNWGMEAINAPGAWAYLDRMQPVRIGLIDSFPNTNHEDLRFAGVFYNGVRVSDDNRRAGSAQHGTHVAGTMAATYNNSIGVTGVIGDKGELYFSARAVDTFYTGWEYGETLKTLIDIDVKVINISQNTSRLVGFAASRGNRNAINRLQQQANIAGNILERLIEDGREFVICVAAGNSNNTTYYPDSSATYGYSENPSYSQSLPFSSGEKGDSQARFNNFLNLISIESVMNRIIVVGSIGIDHDRSDVYETRYHYSAFSNIGDRVDIVGPGERIHSTVVSGYQSEFREDGVMKEWSGTSMATPHVSGVAGLVFASNPNLSGAEVKRILLASTTGRYYYAGGYSGLVNAEIAVINALKTLDQSVNRVIRHPSRGSDGLDLCFVVDTTGSMGPYIDDAKANMREILSVLASKGDNYRVALVDYRDFPERTGNSQDYPSMVQLEFTSDDDAIIAAINELSLGYGGDTPETVYSGLIAAVGLDWRPDSAKAIIVMGDAEPLDPEPFTGYTLDSVVTALFNADIAVDIEHSDARVLGDAADSLIKVYTIGTNPNTEAVDYFSQISDFTGGAYTGVDNAADVSDAIIDSIEQIEVISTISVNTQFGDSYSGETVELYQSGRFVFEFVLDEQGSRRLENMEIDDRFTWEIQRLNASGTMRITDDSRSARIYHDDMPWYSFAVALWQRERTAVIAYGIGGCIALVLLIIATSMLRKQLKSRKLQKVTVAADSGYYNTPAQEFGHYSSPSQEPGHYYSPAQEPGHYNSPAQELGHYNLPVTPSNFICPFCATSYDAPISFCGFCGSKIE